MKRWDNKVKFQVVLEGLRGKPVAEICTQYQIHQAQYYKWRDEFFSTGQKLVFSLAGEQKPLACLRIDFSRSTKDLIPG